LRKVEIGSGYRCVIEIIDYSPEEQPCDASLATPTIAPISRT